MHKIVCYYETVFPANNASSVRAFYFLEELSKCFSNSTIYVITNTQNVADYRNIKFISLKVKSEGRNLNFIFRLFQELFHGFKAVIQIPKINKVNFFFISSPSFFSSFVILLYLIFKKYPYYFEIRDIYPETFLDAKLISLNNPFYKFLDFLVIKIYQNARQNIAATYSIEKIIKLKNIENILTINNGFPESLLNKKVKKFEKFSLVFHGTFGVFQDIETICKVAELLNEYEMQFIFIGDGKKKDLIQFYSSLNKNIIFLGSKSHDETLDIVAKCHIGLSLRTNEKISMGSFPVKNWEYVGLSLPTIVTPKGSEASLFVDKFKIGVSVESGNTEALKKSILDYYKNKELYNETVERINSIKNNYTRELLSKELVKIISSSHLK